MKKIYEEELLYWIRYQTFIFGAVSILCCFSLTKKASDNLTNCTDYDMVSMFFTIVYRYRGDTRKFFDVESTQTLGVYRRSSNELGVHGFVSFVWDMKFMFVLRGVCFLKRILLHQTSMY